MIFHHYCIEIGKDGIQIQVYNIRNECLTHFSQFILEKVKKKLRKSQVQFGEKLRKLRLMQNYGVPMKKTFTVIIDFLAKDIMVDCMKSLLKVDKY